MQQMKELEAMTPPQEYNKKDFDKLVGGLKPNEHVDVFPISQLPIRKEKWAKLKKKRNVVKLSKRKNR